MLIAINGATWCSAYLADGRLVELAPGTVVEVALFWQVNRLAAGQLADLTRGVLGAARENLAVEGCEPRQTR